MSSDSKVDILVFGASGFTGKFVVAELVKLQRSKSTPSFTFGIAGRSLSKLHCNIKICCIFYSFYDLKRHPVFMILFGMRYFQYLIVSLYLFKLYFPFIMLDFFAKFFFVHLKKSCLGSGF